MKISYRTHPVLNALKRIPERDDISEEVKKFISNFRYVTPFILSDSFLKSAIEHCQKLGVNSIYREVRSSKLIYITKNVSWNVQIINERIKKQLCISIAKVGANGGVFFGKDYIVGYEGDDGFTYSEENNDHILVFGCITIMLFKQYAPIEVKLLESNKKTKDIAVKYFNSTDNNVILLDSSWFTTLVKSDAFKVRGHFRLQPKKKDGEWTKELIWINDFQKEGYTAPARKLSMQDVEGL